MGLVRSLVARLLAAVPSGTTRFTFMDPVGRGQNFASFMHLADVDDDIVGTKIWTEAAQIDQRLNDTMEHMENVIQKYLRGEYKTIDEYNKQAGELAEPYRFLVISDFTAGFSTDAQDKLASIISSGKRCGVYVIIARDTRQPRPKDTLMDTLRQSGLWLQMDGDKVIWKSSQVGDQQLTLDEQPDEGKLKTLLEEVGEGAINAKRVEVPFTSITPQPGEMWSRSAAKGLDVPVGRSGATRIQEFQPWQRRAPARAGCR